MTSRKAEAVMEKWNNLREFFKRVFIPSPDAQKGLRVSTVQNYKYFKSVPTSGALRATGVLK